MRALLIALLAASTLLALPARAADNYSFTFQGSTQQTQTDGFKAIDPFLGGLLQAASGSAFFFDLNLRGLAATLSTDGPTFLILDIPSLGINRTFSAQTPEDTFAQLKAFLLSGDQASVIARESARVSPFDPVAGNPSSLMGRAVAYDFFSAFYPFASNIVGDNAMIAQAGGGIPAGAVGGPFRPLPGLGLAYSNFHDQGLRTQSFTLPLSMTFRSDLDPRRQFTIGLPITVQDVDGARAYQGTLSAALRLPLARDWAVTTALGYSQVRATELGTAGQIGSVAVTSAYVFRTAMGDLALGNMIGYYRTLSGTLNGISTGSGIGDTVFRNGLLWSNRAAWLGGLTIEYSLINTHYAGTALYNRNYTEVGVMVGSNKRADSVRSYMQGGLSYLFSSKTKGFSANFAYWF